MVTNINRNRSMLEGACRKTKKTGMQKLDKFVSSGYTKTVFEILGIEISKSN